MPALSPITIEDRESVPVTHVFSPDGKENGVQTFKASTGTPIGDEVISMSIRKQAKTIKVWLRLEVPVVVTETINGVTSPKVDRLASASLTFTFDRKSTTQERANIVGLAAQMLSPTAAPLLDAVIVNLEHAY